MPKVTKTEKGDLDGTWLNLTGKTSVVEIAMGGKTVYVLDRKDMSANEKRRGNAKGKIYQKSGTAPQGTSNAVYFDGNILPLGKDAPSKNNCELKPTPRPKRHINRVASQVAIYAKPKRPPVAKKIEPVTFEMTAEARKDLRLAFEAKMKDITERKAKNVQSSRKLARYTPMPECVVNLFSHGYEGRFKAVDKPNNKTRCCCHGWCYCCTFGT